MKDIDNSLQHLIKEYFTVQLQLLLILDILLSWQFKNFALLHWDEQTFR